MSFEVFENISFYVPLVLQSNRHLPAQSYQSIETKEQGVKYLRS